MKPLLLLVGLGNPGTQYRESRHNTGFRAVDILAEEFGTGPWQEQQRFSALVREGRVITVPILLVKPQTYMNRSGEAVQKLVRFFKLDPTSQLLILCDDIDIEVGSLRLQRSGSAGSHNGLKSIVEQFGEAFPRLRIGIGSPVGVGKSARKAGEDLSTYVLSKPMKGERAKMEKTMALLPKIVREFVLEPPRSS
jgi:PTH1 family peptidyl-tRNA hydrolase